MVSLADALVIGDCHDAIFISISTDLHFNDLHFMIFIFNDQRSEYHAILNTLNPSGKERILIAHILDSLQSVRAGGARA
jgi:hypothetical protein